MSALRRVLLSNTQIARASLGSQIQRIHGTAIALKKKKHATSSYSHLGDTSDVFSSDQLPEDEELFSTAAPELPQLPIDPITRGPLSVLKTPKFLRMRRDMFDSQRTSTLAILGRPGKLRQPPRKSAIVRLVALAETKEQLGQVLEVVAAWRNAALSLSPNTCDEFIRRCVHLKYPELALKALQNRPMYGVDVPSLTSARHLLKALARPRTGVGPTATLRDCLALAEIFPLYGLPQASKDVISCTILARLIARQIPEDKSSLQQQGTSGPEVLPDPFWEIMGELNVAMETWEGVRAMKPNNVLPGLRGNVETLLRTVRRRGGTPQPLLQQLRTEILHHSAERELDTVN